MATSTKAKKKTVRLASGRKRVRQDIKLNAAGNGLVKPGPGSGEMNYPLLISEIRKLHRPLSCIIEHIKPEPAEMTKTKVWVEKQLKVGS